MNRFVWMLVLPVLVLAGCRESEDFVPEVIFEEFCRRRRIQHMLLNKESV